MNNFIIVSSFRSGSTLLNEAISQHPNLNVSYEVLHQNSLDGNVSWRDTFFIPFELNEKFVAAAMNEFDGFKILYHQLPASHKLWNYFLDNAKIVHLIRKNIAETIVSFISCRDTDIWQRRNSKNLDFTPVNIEPLELFNRIEKLDKTIILYKKLFKNNSLLLYYENLIKNWDQELSKIYKFIGADNFQANMTTHKRSPPLNKLLANYDLHKDFFRQTIYCDFFEN